MEENKDLWLEIPSYAWISLARRGMEKISLDQCFLIGCDNEDQKLLEPLKIEKQEDDKKQTKYIHIRCKKCNGVFQLKLETIKKVARPLKNIKSKGVDDEKEIDDEAALSMGLVYALDEKGKNLGHVGYF